jgi:hypothetical protein
MKTSLLVLLITGSWWLCIPTVAVEGAEGDSKGRKERTSSEVAAKISRSSVEVSQKKLAPKTIKTVQPTEPGQQPETKTVSSAKGTKIVPGELGNAPGRKPHRVIKTSKKVPRKAVVSQPRTDLMHYGVLEDSQRYDPRPHTHAAGVPNPQTPDLTHDHFQELDRNMDGKIDPVERAFGRIDMDRDLNSRTFK